MPLSKQLQVDLHAMLLSGKSYASIARQLSISLSTISKYRKIFKIALAPRKGGRPALITPSDKRRLVHLIRSGRVDTAPEAMRLLGLRVSNQTVRNALREGGLRARVKAKKPLLQRRHFRHRLAFALAHRHWTLEDWSRVIFSDETKINRMGSDGRRYCYKMPGEELSKRTVQLTVKHGGGSTMVWGCMTTRGVGKMCIIDGIMDAQKYTRILDTQLPATIKMFKMRRNFIFQQDGDPKHPSATAREWFETQDINVLDWPAQSPDLNPIEHLWDHLKRRLNTYEAHPTSIHELERRIHAEWASISPQVCADLIASMPRRLEAVIRAKGGYTKY